MTLNALLARLLEEFDRLIEEPHVIHLVPFGDGVRLVVTTPPPKKGPPETLANVTSRRIPPVLKDAVNGLVGAAMAQYRKRRSCSTD